MADVLNLYIEAGDSQIWELLWQTEETLAPIDISGCTALMEFKRSYSDQDALLVLTTENGGIEILEDPGWAAINITGDRSILLGSDRVTSGVHDLLFFFDGVPKKPVKGRWKCSPLASKSWLDGAL